MVGGGFTTSPSSSSLPSSALAEEDDDASVIASALLWPSVALPPLLLVAVGDTMAFEGDATCDSGQCQMGKNNRNQNQASRHCFVYFFLKTK